MDDGVTLDDVAATDDVDVLWRALRDAKQQDDPTMVRAIENRMRHLGDERRFSHLSDDQLRARISALSGNREPEDLLAFSPASGEGHDGAADTAALNRGIKANQRDGVERTLGALLDELQRRDAGSG